MGISSLYLAIAMLGTGAETERRKVLLTGEEERRQEPLFELTLVSMTIEQKGW